MVPGGYNCHGKENAVCATRFLPRGCRCCLEKCVPATDAAHRGRDCAVAPKCQVLGRRLPSSPVPSRAARTAAFFIMRVSPAWRHHLQPPHIAFLSVATRSSWQQRYTMFHQGNHSARAAITFGEIFSGQPADRQCRHLARATGLPRHLPKGCSSAILTKRAIDRRLTLPRHHPDPAAGWRSSA